MKGDLSPLEQAEKQRYAKEYETCQSISELSRRLWVSWPTAKAKLQRYKLLKTQS